MCHGGELLLLFYYCRCHCAMVDLMHIGTLIRLCGSKILICIGFKFKTLFRGSFEHIIVHTFRPTTRRVIEDANTLSIEPRGDARERRITKIEAGDCRG